MEEIENIILAVKNNQPIYLRDVAPSRMLSRAKKFQSNQRQGQSFDFYQQAVRCQYRQMAGYKEKLEVKKILASRC